MIKIRQLAFLLIATLFSITTYSQVVVGKVMDSTQKQSLKDATVSLLDATDSTLEEVVLAKPDGSFELRRVKPGSYLLHIIFLNYSPFYKKVTINDLNSAVDVGTVYLQPKATSLNDIVVVQSPIVMKKDTVEFNASSFKTKPNAVAEDLLKKLPGVEVASDGTVKAQGEQVKRILVDGKRFFGDDPLMATKNLPPDVIDKIQVFDDLSDQSKFTGFDDGNRVKTINITTKKDKRKGYFGKAVAAAGTDETYDEMFNFHRFNSTKQISALGQANDVNKQNFSNQDILGTGGGRGGRGSGGGTGSGITTTWSGGTNLRQDWKNNSTFSGSYFYNQQHNSIVQNSLTQNIITADSSNYNNQSERDLKMNYNHRINLNLEENFDSSNSLTIRPNISFQKTDYTTNQLSNLTTAILKPDSIYNTNYGSLQNNKGYNGSVDLSLKHKFKKNFRTTSLALNIQKSNNDGSLNNNSVNDYFKPIHTDSVFQNITTGSTGFSISPTLSYTEPLAKNQMMEINVNYNYSKNTALRNTHNQQQVFEPTYSNDFENTYHSSRVTLSYRLQNAKYNFNIGTGVQVGELNSINHTTDSTINQRYTNFTPTANFTYNFSKSNNLRIYYTGRTGQPSVSQLQPVTTTNDSINFSKGNPSLQQQFTHSFRFLYTNFDMATQRVIFASINASTIVNDIQNSTFYNRGSQTTMPVNLSGTYNVSGYFNYGFPLKKPKSNLSFITNFSYSQSQNLVQDTSNFTRNTTMGESISWTTNMSEKFDVNFKSSTNYNIANYSLQPTQNANYITQTFSVEATYYSKSGWMFATQFDYTYSGNRTAGYNTSVPLLNPYIAKQFLKNKAGELKLSIFDLLNQNTSVSRTISNNTITDSRTNTLTRYAQLTFTYNLRRFNDKKDGRMPSFMRGAMRGMKENGGGRMKDF